ncbi:TatD family hydrolase [Saccharicrinis fermentans]|uniref:Putative deoxyribonuclease YjjV n=1 Tax=Saccharicrinis fermentans DSM 9555 = JCM 21142 TaxID=869213 RepID=W7YI53_9BACT|nr:TatD family hydrolase [Saccharicrinis fermentans]GAF04166.1 putative deoxyribonuclease YjjV [Saccharicrinis fermentans DSM 9555 = JCM 21142]
MSVIDTHSHIYSEQFDEDRDEMIQRAFAAGVEYILMPNVDLDSIEPMLHIQDKYPDKCLSMMGLHPTSVGSEFMQQLAAMEAWFQKRKFCAVGEIGIDLYWDKTYIAEQVAALKIQIGWAKKYHLPVVLHVREAFDTIFEVLDSVSLDGVWGVCHSFTGNLEQARKFLSYGCFKLGINGVLTFKNSGLGDVVKQLSLDDLVLETDAPYLTPVPYRGKRNEPLYVQHVKNKVAELFATTEEEVDRITSQNARRLFAL